MTKTEFYKELQNVGVDVSDPVQMKVWSMALLAMGKNQVDHKLDRCPNCYFAGKAMVDGKVNMDACPNRFCPMKHIPDTPGAAVEYMFKKDFPLNIQAFFNEYVDPILKRLAEEERKQMEESQNAGQ